MESGLLRARARKSPLQSTPADAQRLDVAPPFPTRQMIAVTVMFGGLIAPALYGALAVLRFGILAIPVSLFLLALSAGPIWLLVSLWKGRLWAWYLAIVPFGFGIALGVALATAGLLWGDSDALRWGAATLSYGGCGLGALISLRGKWWRNREWTLAQDPLLRVDRKAAAEALRRLTRASRSNG